MPSATLADVVAIMEGLYPPSLAASWDAVGLVCGDPAQPVNRILFAVDPVEVVVDEALSLGAELLVTHHPLFLHGTSSVAATTAKGRSVHRLIRAGIALHVAHTNADHANPGVSDALAGALGLVDTRPLDPLPAPPLDKVVTFVPEPNAEKLLDALAAAGAGEIGDYARCAWTAAGVGTFQPLVGANPTIGAVGEVTRVDEIRIEMVLPRASRADVVRALRAAHPYEEPAFDVFELASWPGDTGTGRVGELPTPMTPARVRDGSRLGPALHGRRWPRRGGSGRHGASRSRSVAAPAIATCARRRRPARRSSSLPTCAITWFRSTLPMVVARSSTCRIGRPNGPGLVRPPTPCARGSRNAALR